MTAARGRADLHAHTSCSDGTFSPRELAERAAAVGLDVLAVTDHDSVRGVEPAAEAARGRLRIIAGVELSATDGRADVHLLGYGVDPRDARLLARLEEFRAARRRRGEEMVCRLRQLGLDIRLEEVEAAAGEGSVGRPHVAGVLLERGYVKSLSEAFHRYLVPNRPAYVPKMRVEITEGIRLLREAGAVPVLAHPGTLRRDDLIPAMMAAGLMGIEAVHPQHDPGQEDHYRRLAAEHGLVATGGSDTHGERDGAEFFLGVHTVSLEVVAELDRLGRSVRVASHSPDPAAGAAGTPDGWNRARGPQLDRP